ncbi:hypothetical protein B0H34DRAFT_480797 [Crassisporium funariophilum]|nr:hypothetical protein B0H34DRAFT_480797 [Crassisporium funariophilum]
MSSQQEPDHQDKLPPSSKVYVHTGLDGLDEHFEVLQGLFKELQDVTVETSAPHLDLLDFALGSYYFGVIVLQTPPGAEDEDIQTSDVIKPDDSDEDAEGELEEESEDVSDDPASSRTMSSATLSESSGADLSPRRASLLGRGRREDAYSVNGRSDSPMTTEEQEKVLKWRVAFFAKLDERQEEFVPTPNLGGIPFDFGQGSQGSTLQSSDPKGKMPELPDMQMNDDANDLINWPEDDPADGHQGNSSRPDESPVDHEQTFDQSETYYYNSSYESLGIVEPDAEFGREYLEPEVYDTPVVELPEIPIDPKMQAIIYEAAVKYQNELRARRIEEYQNASVNRPEPNPPPTPPPIESLPPLPSPPPADHGIIGWYPSGPAPRSRKTPIGLIYLTSSQTFDDPLRMGELYLGMYVTPEHRGKSYLVDAINQVVKVAFDDPECHRIQAIIVNNKDILETRSMYSSAGFSQEGMRRSGFRSPITSEWKDVIYYAMLAREWVYDTNGTGSCVRLRPNSLWGEVISRQQKERDELLRLEEKTLKRSSSTETIREKVSATTILDTESESSSDAVDSSPPSLASSRGWSPKRRRVELGQSLGTPDLVSSIEDEVQPGLEISAVTASAITRRERIPSPTDTEIMDGYASSVSSSMSEQWDMLGDA